MGDRQYSKQQCLKFLNIYPKWRSVVSPEQNKMFKPVSRHVLVKLPNIENKEKNFKAIERKNRLLCRMHLVSCRTCSRPCLWFQLWLGARLCEGSNTPGVNSILPHAHVVRPHSLPRCSSSAADTDRSSPIPNTYAVWRSQYSQGQPLPDGDGSRWINAPTSHSLDKQY